MRSISRATAVFIGALVVVAGFGFVMRNVLHLDCVGPVLPAWGCLAEPFPDSLTSAAVTSSNLLRYVLVGVVLWVVCYALRDLLLSGLAALIRRAFPGWLRERKLASQPPRSYRIR